MSVYEIFDCLRVLEELDTILPLIQIENPLYHIYHRLFHRMESLHPKLKELAWRSKDDNRHFAKTIRSLPATLIDLRDHIHYYQALTNILVIDLINGIEFIGEISAKLLTCQCKLLSADTTDDNEDDYEDEDKYQTEDITDIYASLSKCTDIDMIPREVINEIVSSTLHSFGHMSIQITFIEDYEIENTNQLVASSNRLHNHPEVEVAVSEPIDIRKCNELFGDRDALVEEYPLRRQPSMAETCNSSITGSIIADVIPKLELPHRIPCTQKHIQRFLTAAATSNLKELDHIFHDTDLPYDLACDMHGNNALCIAAEYGQIYSIEYLLNLNIPIDTVNNFGYSPLMICAVYGYLDCVRLLLQRGANLYLTSKDRKSAKDIAKKYNNTEIKRLLKSCMGQSCGGYKMKLFGYQPYIPSLKFHIPIYSNVSPEFDDLLMSSS